MTALPWTTKGQGQMIQPDGCDLYGPERLNNIPHVKGRRRMGTLKDQSLSMWEDTDIKLDRIFEPLDTSRTTMGAEGIMSFAVCGVAICRHRLLNLHP